MNYDELSDTEEEGDELDLMATITTGTRKSTRQSRTNNIQRYGYILDSSAILSDSE